MNAIMNYESIFGRYDGIMRTCKLTSEGISYQMLQKLIRQGKVEKIKYGYYQWQDDPIIKPHFIEYFATKSHISRMCFGTKGGKSNINLLSLSCVVHSFVNENGS